MVKEQYDKLPRVKILTMGKLRRWGRNLVFHCLIMIIGSGSVGKRMSLQMENGNTQRH